MSDKYFNIVVLIARVEDDPNLSWGACQRCAKRFFSVADSAKLDIDSLKEGWRRFQDASGGKVFSGASMR